MSSTNSKQHNVASRTLDLERRTRDAQTLRIAIVGAHLKLNPTPQFNPLASNVFVNRDGDAEPVIFEKARTKAARRLERNLMFGRA